MFKRISKRLSRNKYEGFDKGDPAKAFELLECLGEGTYGMVWTAQDLKNSNRLVAVKIVPIDNDLDEIKLEIDIMKKSESPYIIKLFSNYVSRDEQHIWMAMQVCEAGSVNDLMFITDDTLSESQIKEVAAATAMGLAYLHERLIIHRDIKAGNILLNSQGHVKIADFGVSAKLKSKDDRCTTAIGAPFWMAPEVISESPYDGRADVWSLGITVIEMAESRPPNSHIHPMRALFVIPNKPAPTMTEPERWSNDLNSFVGNCLQKNIKKRAFAKDLVKHPFISKTAQRLEKHGGKSHILETLVRKCLPAIEAFRNMDESESEYGGSVSDNEDEYDDEEEAEMYHQRTKATGKKSTMPSFPEPRGSSASMQTFVMLNEDQVKNASVNRKKQDSSRKSGGSFKSMVKQQGTAPHSGRANIVSERRLNPIRPPLTDKATLKKKAATLTQSGKFHPIRPISTKQQRAPSSKNHPSTKTLDRLLEGEGNIISKSEQNKMQMDDLRKLLEPNQEKKKQSVRRPDQGQNLPPDDQFAATVMSKKFINLVKKSKVQAPELFDMLDEDVDPAQAMEVAIAALRLAAGKKVIKNGSSGASGSNGGSDPPPPPPSPFL